MTADIKCFYARVQMNTLEQVSFLDQDQMEKEIKRKFAYQLAEEILNNGMTMFTKEHEYNGNTPFSVIYRARVFIANKELYDQIK